MVRASQSTFRQSTRADGIPCSRTASRAAGPAVVDGAAAPFCRRWSGAASVTARELSRANSRRHAQPARARTRPRTNRTSPDAYDVSRWCPTCWPCFDASDSDQPLPRLWRGGRVEFLARGHASGAELWSPISTPRGARQSSKFRPVFLPRPRRGARGRRHHRFLTASGRRRRGSRRRGAPRAPPSSGTTRER